MKSEDKPVRILRDALIASAPTDPSYVIYFNSMNTWEVSPDVALTETEKQEVVSAIRKHFQDRGSVVEFNKSTHRA